MMGAPVNINDNVDPMQLDPIPANIPVDIEYLGDRLDKLIAIMTDIRQATLQQTSPSSGIYFAQAAHNDFPQTVRTRITGVLVAVSAACIVTVTVGSASLAVFDFVGADTKYIPLPITIDSGKDVVITASAGILHLGAFLGYAESDRP